ncbi:MAG: hydantoinase/oxoprolinase family protein [Planctomycetales bacterium]
MKVVGLDIGGANLKAATDQGICCSRPFPLWQRPEMLAEEIRMLLSRLRPSEILAVTMTGELADCFATKADGVRRILESVEAASAGREIRVWTTQGKFVAPAEARREWSSVAAANWHALATWLGREQKIQNGLLVDIGSTTTDLIPISNQHPCTLGLTDVGRLMAGELVYAGVWRTPFCAVLEEVPFRDEKCPLGAELFSTTGDAFLLLGEIAEEPGNCDTANGKPATIEAAYDRLVRQICCDRTEVSLAEARLIATGVKQQLKDKIGKSLNRVLSRLSKPCETVVVSGSGEFFARQIVAAEESLQHVPVVSLAEKLSPEVATAACGYAVAKLAQNG